VCSPSFKWISTGCPSLGVVISILPPSTWTSASVVPLERPILRQYLHLRQRSAIVTMLGYCEVTCRLEGET
jgi:hypothetical protein